MPIHKTIIAAIEDSIGTKTRMLYDTAMLEAIENTALRCIQSLQDGGKILLCGNGGSAADAQHIAAELSGRFRMERKPLYAEALTVNTSYLTAVANDYSFDEVFARMVRAKGKPGDVLIGISTSGNSPNVVKAMQTAKSLGLHAIGLSGFEGGSILAHCDVAIRVPASDTARVQEAHILVGHILCQLIEEGLFQ